MAKKYKLVSGGRDELVRKILHELMTRKELSSEEADQMIGKLCSRGVLSIVPARPKHNRDGECTQLSLPFDSQ